MSVRNKVRGFYIIPIKKLDNRYSINNQCTILDNLTDSIIYKWGDEFKKIVKLWSSIEKSWISLEPINIFMLTFYGYMPSKIIDPYNTNFPLDYRYDIHDVVDTGKIIYVDGVEFRKCPLLDNTYINEYGVIYNIKHNKICKYSFPYADYNYREYWRIKLHILVYTSWIGDIEEGYEIHHRDDNDWNNHFTNLIRLTKEEHKKIHNMLYLDEKTVHEICRRLKNKELSWEIAKDLGISSQHVTRIQNRDAWTNISSEYGDLGTPSKKTNMILTEDDVIKICELFKEDELDNAQIALKFGVNPYTIQDIRKGSTWKDITKNYNFERKSNLNSKTSCSPHNAKISEDQVKEIWKRLQAGQKQVDISREMGVSYSSVKKIRQRSRWTSVTDNLGPLPND